MSYETVTANTEKDIIRVGDDTDKLRSVLQQAVTGGRQHEDHLHVEIPVDDELAYWGSSEWHMTEDGRFGKANELFSAMLSEVTGMQIALRGSAPVSTGEGDATQLMLLATISCLQVA